jgi:hypothetical protein
MSLGDIGLIAFFGVLLVNFWVEAFLVAQMKGELPEVHRELGSPGYFFPIGWRGIASPWADFIFGGQYRSKLASVPYLRRAANIVFWLYVAAAIAGVVWGVGVLSDI